MLFRSATDPQAIEKLKTDDPITVTIDAIDTRDKKITLSPADSITAKDVEQYTSGGSSSNKQDSSGMGDLGQKLQDALKSKK